MKALITGASSGIGLDMARYLSTKKVELFLVSRSKEKLEMIQKELPTKVTVIVADLSFEQKVKELYALVKKENIDILINNAGFGKFGNFTDTSLNDEIEMIDLNIKAVHILTKLFLKDMKKKNNGYILNVASAAAFAPGPKMATYYATKSYVYSLTEAIYYELKKEKVDGVHISCLAPGPVATNFNRVAGVRFSIKPLRASDVAKYAIDNMFKGKMLIIPGLKMKLAKFGTRLLSDKQRMYFIYNNQRKKIK